MPQQNKNSLIAMWLDTGKQRGRRGEEERGGGRGERGGGEGGGAGRRRGEEERGGGRREGKHVLILINIVTGKVQVYDVRKYLTAVDSGSSSLLPKKEASKYQVTAHKNEGFALDWSPTVMGR